MRILPCPMLSKRRREARCRHGIFLEFCRCDKTATNDRYQFLQSRGPSRNLSDLLPVSLKKNRPPDKAHRQQPLPHQSMSALRRSTNISSIIVVYKQNKRRRHPANLDHSFAKIKIASSSKQSVRGIVLQLQKTKGHDVMGRVNFSAC